MPTIATEPEDGTPEERYEAMRKLLAETCKLGRGVERHVQVLEATINSVAKYLNEANSLKGSEGERRKFLIGLARDLVTDHISLPDVYWPEDML